MHSIDTDPHFHTVAALETSGLMFARIESSHFRAIHAKWHGVGEGAYDDDRASAADAEVASGIAYMKRSVSLSLTSRVPNTASQHTGGMYDFIWRHGSHGSVQDCKWWTLNAQPTRSDARPDGHG
jgi:hypothetical protein